MIRDRRCAGTLLVFIWGDSVSKGLFWQSTAIFRQVRAGFDRKNGIVFNSAPYEAFVGKVGYSMFDIFRNKRNEFCSQVHTLSWYPSDRTCSPVPHQENRPKKVPPLMVRKAEWRR